MYLRSPSPRARPMSAGSPPSAVATPIELSERSAPVKVQFSANACASALAALAPMLLPATDKNASVRFARSAPASAIPAGVVSSLRARSRCRRVLFCFKVAENSLATCSRGRAGAFGRPLLKANDGLRLVDRAGEGWTFGFLHTLQSCSRRLCMVLLAYHGLTATQAARIVTTTVQCTLHSQYCYLDVFSDTDISYP